MWFLSKVPMRYGSQLEDSCLVKLFHDKQNALWVFTIFSSFQGINRKRTMPRSNPVNGGLMTVGGVWSNDLCSREADSPVLNPVISLKLRVAEFTSTL